MGFHDDMNPMPVDFLRDILWVEPNRRPTTEQMLRRLAKLAEEHGELAEAILFKQNEQVLEEAVDVAIMGMLIALSSHPDLPDENQIDMIERMFVRKLAKWKQKADQDEFYKSLGQTESKTV